MFFFGTLYQLYIFNVTSTTYQSYNLKSVKVNDLTNIIKYKGRIFTLNEAMGIIYDVHQNTPNSIDGSFNNIFEKNIYIHKNTIIELYNYNLQKLVQPNNIIILILLFLILLFLILLNFKKKIILI